MQAQQGQQSDTRNLEELLAAFKLMQAAAKPLGRCQSELALAAVLNASKVVANTPPHCQSASPTYQHPRCRASSLPIGIPSLLRPSAASGDLVRAVPPRVDGSPVPLRLASPQSDRLPIETCLYKTEMCRGWEASGRCRYGSRCQFAHGAQELQPVQRHPKYKTEICRVYAQTGLCRYGKRCRFIHPETDTGLNLLPNTPPQTDIQTLHQSPILAQEPCNQHNDYCSASPSNPDSRSFAPFQPRPLYSQQYSDQYSDQYSGQYSEQFPQQYSEQYSGLHPAIYHDRFLLPCSRTTPSQALPRPIQEYSGPAPATHQHQFRHPASRAAQAAQSELTTPYSSSTGSACEERAHLVTTPLSTAGGADASSRGLLGSGYSRQESDGLMPAGSTGGVTSPRSVLEYAALQGCGYTSRDQGRSHPQVGVPVEHLT
ncbi:hypothetical protein ABBQ38_002744 [Trebouxia sp. C0009 RCD-2024]